MKFSGAGALKRALNPLIVVPTTSRNRSEATLAAVCQRIMKDIEDCSLPAIFLLPDVAVLDSRMTLNASPRNHRCDGMDALTHAMEALYLCLAKNPLSDAHALLAIDLISTNSSR